MADPLAERLYLARERWEQAEGPTPDMFTMFANECRAFLAERVTEEQIARIVAKGEHPGGIGRMAKPDGLPCSRCYSKAKDILALLQREMGQPAGGA